MLSTSIGVDQDARASDANSVKTWRGRRNRENNLAKFIRRAGCFWIVSVIGLDEKILTCFDIPIFNEKLAGIVPSHSSYLQ